MIKRSVLIILLESMLMLLGCAAPAAQTAAGVSHTPAGTEPWVSVPAITGVSKDKSGYYTCGYSGVKRRYMLYIPEGTGSGAPLVFMLHGSGSSAKGFISYTGMNEAAKRYGFAVVYPQVIGVGKSGASWNTGSADSGNDDIGFLTALAKYLQQTYGFDSGKTFAAGFSDGAFMVYKLACEAPDTFRAVASVAGAMNRAVWDERDDSVSIGILQINGTNDGVVPVSSALSAVGGYGGAPVVSGFIEYWRNANGLDEARETKLSEKATVYEYSGKPGDDLVWYIEIEGLGHEWPKEETAGFDAGEVILGFFSKFC